MISPASGPVRFSAGAIFKNTRQVKFMAHETDHLLREVEEDLRRERYQRLWDKYGVYVLAGAFVIIAGVAGTKYWEYSSAKKAALSGETFVSALDLSRDKKPEEAAKILSGFVNSGSGGYSVLSRFKLAVQTAKSGQTAAAVEAYDNISKDSSVSTIMQGYARIRAAMLLMDSAGWTEIENRLNDLTKVDNAWRGTARELIGLAAYKAGQVDAAKERFSAILGEQSVTPGLRQRAEMMLGLLLSGDTKKTAPAKEEDKKSTAGSSN